MRAIANMTVMCQQPTDQHKTSMRAAELAGPVYLASVAWACPSFTVMTTA